MVFLGAFPRRATRVEPLRHPTTRTAIASGHDVDSATRVLTLGVILSWNCKPSGCKSECYNLVMRFSGAYFFGLDVLNGKRWTIGCFRRKAAISGFFKSKRPPKIGPVRFQPSRPPYIGPVQNIGSIPSDGFSICLNTILLYLSYDTEE